MTLFRKTLVLAALFATMVFAPTSWAQDASGSAYGESVDLSIETLFDLATVEVSSGPLPSVDGATPPAYAASDSLLGVDVDANLKLVSAILPATAVGILETGVLEVDTTGDGGPFSESNASVDDVDLELLGTVLLPLTLGITADEVTAQAQASGTCGSGLDASGGSLLTSATLASDLAELAGVTGALVANPPPNFVLLDLDLFGGHLRIVLNEQIITGDGATSIGITVNAIHVTIEDLPIAGIVTDVNGEIIISQATAQATCVLADLAIDISDSPDPVTSGDPLTYTLDVSNLGPDSAGSVQVTQQLPMGVTFGSAVASQGGCSESGGQVTCELGTIANGGTADITVTVTPTVPGMIQTSAEVASDAADPDLSNNQDVEDTEVVSPPGAADLSVSITDSPDPVMAGSSLDITLDIGNAGPDAATQTVVTYPVPAGVTIQTVTPDQGNCAVSSSLISCSLGTVNNGAGAQVVIGMTPLVAGTLFHEANVASEVFDPDTGNNQDTEETTVVTDGELSADLAVVKTDSPDPVLVGQQLTYTLSVSNAGPDDTTNTLVVDTLPGGVTFVSAIPSQGSCAEAGGTVSCSLGGIANGGNAVITIVVVPTAAGVLVNTAVVSSDVDDPNSEDNSDSEDTTVNAPSADLSVTKDHDQDPVPVNTQLTYTIMVENGGPDDATDVVVTDTLPASVILDGMQPSQGSCAALVNVVTCQLGTLANGAGATIVLLVTPTQPGLIDNVVGVTSGVNDPNPQNNSFTLRTQVQGPPPPPPAAPPVPVPVMGWPSLAALVLLFLLTGLAQWRPVTGRRLP